MYKAACMLLRSRCLSWAAVVECRYRSNCFKTQRSCQAAKLWVKKHKPALFRKPSMILWSSAKKKKKQQPTVCVSDVHFHQKADHQKEGICKWQSVCRVDGKHGGCTGRRCDYFSVPQEAVAGLKAQLIRSCSRKLNYIVREERERFFGEKCAAPQAPWWLSETWNRAVLLTESLFGVRVGLLEDRMCFCAPSLPNGTQTVVIKFEGTNISIKVSPPWPLPTLNELQLFLCACMCVSIHEWAVNDWHQQTGILARAHSSLTTSL